MERRRRGRNRRRAHRDVPRRFRARVGPTQVPAHDRDRARDLCGAPRDLPHRVLQHRDEAVARPVGQGNGEVRPPLPLPRRRRRLSVAALDALLLEGRRRTDRRAGRERRLRRPAAARGTRRDEPRPCPALAADRWSELDQRLRRDRRHRRLQAECAHNRPQPSRRDDLHPAADLAAGVPEARARAQDARAARGRARLPLPRHALDAFAQWAARDCSSGCSCLRFRTAVGSCHVRSSCR